MLPFNRPKFKENDQVRKPRKAINSRVLSVGYTGRVWKIHRESGWLFRKYSYLVIPNEPVAGSYHQLLAHEYELVEAPK